MSKIVFRESDGEETMVSAKSGLTLMEVAVRSGVNGIDAECGGGCSCGTCHVHIEASRFASFPPPDGMETDLLEMVQNRTSCSRLACQITIEDIHDGLLVIVPSPNGPT